MTKRFAVHPILFAIYPVIFLLSVNAGQIDPQQSVRPLFVSLLAACLLMLVFSLAIKDIAKGSLLATLFLGVFYTYGHAAGWIEGKTDFQTGRLILVTVYACIIIGCGFAIYKTQNPATPATYLNTAAIVLLIQPVFVLAQFYYKSGFSPEPVEPSAIEAPASSGETPDIYYIIVDAHGRSDVVRDIYGYDNSFFINSLKEKGFFVADQSHSNYVQTTLSLSSSLNYEYLNDLELNPESTDRGALKDLILHSKIRRFLEQSGYKTVAFSSGYSSTNFDDADIIIEYKPHKMFTDFEDLLLSTSLIRILDKETQNKWFVDPLQCDNRRGYILNIFENLKTIPKIPGKKFVFAHILSPHPPFIFDANGNPVERGGCRVNDGEYFTGTKEDYMLGYPEQMIYIDKLLEETVTEILNNSPTPPIIIIQGDHGSGMMLDWDSARKTCQRERTSILNAYYFPNGDYEDLYQGVSPVNTFRTVLNLYFGASLPLLEDRTYYSQWYSPYNFVDVTDRVNDACKQ